MQRLRNACAPNRQNGSTPKGQHATPPQRHPATVLSIRAGTTQ